MTSSRAILDEIAADNLSGAAAIYLKAIEYFRAVLGENRGATTSELRSVFVDSGRALLGAQSEMAPLYNLVAEILNDLGQLERDSGILDRINAKLARLAEDQRNSAKLLARNTTDLISGGSTVLTISSSSAVRDCILQHPARSSLTVVIPESRPMREGVQLAEALGDSGVRTILIVDFAIGNYIGSADLFICGADAVTESFIVNKIGTTMVSGLMRSAGKSAIVLFTEAKLIPSAVLRFEPRLHDKSEVSIITPPLCSVENHYFEACPLENFTHLVSDGDVYSVDSIRHHLTQRTYPDHLT